MKMAFFILLVLLLGAFWFMGQSHWHLQRNEHNLLPQGELKLVNNKIYTDAAGRKWELQPAIKNKFHQPDQAVDKPEKPYPNVEGGPDFDPDNPNLKFLSKSDGGGSYEAILQPDGTFLTEGGKKGTYNYGHPDGLWGSLKHVVLDVIPHFVNSNYRE